MPKKQLLSLLGLGVICILNCGTRGLDSSSGLDHLEMTQSWPPSRGKIVLLVLQLGSLMFFFAFFCHMPSFLPNTASGYVHQNFVWQGLMHGADWLPTLVEGAAEQRRDWVALGY